MAIWDGLRTAEEEGGASAWLRDAAALVCAAISVMAVALLGWIALSPAP